MKERKMEVFFVGININVSLDEFKKVFCDPGFIDLIAIYPTLELDYAELCTEEDVLKLPKYNCYLQFYERKDNLKIVPAAIVEKSKNSMASLAS